jgi:hypothetical protein
MEASPCSSCINLWCKDHKSNKVDIGRVIDLQNRRNCSCCNLILSALHQNLGRRAKESLEPQFITVQGHIKKRKLEPNNGSRTPKTFRFMDSSGREAWISLNEERAMDPGQEGTVRRGMVPDVRLVPDLINVSLIRSWVENCEGHEWSCARIGLGRSIDWRIRQADLILIDVYEQMLIRVSSNDKKRYLALSYVWGDAEIFRTVENNFELLQQPGALYQPHIMLPQVFQDAIRLTEMLEERFLWIDALCIIQDDDMVQHQLQIMDLIYSRAFLTIVALAGNHANFGLPGIRPGTRVRTQLTASFNNGTLVAGLPGLKEAVDGSTHTTRGWTFQETYLSRRCLYVSEEQMFFRCNKSLFSEACGLIPPLDVESELGLAAVTGVTGKYRIDMSWFTYHHCVEEYSRRSLRYDSDIIAAFSGIIHARAALRYVSCVHAGIDLNNAFCFLWVSVKKGSERRSVLNPPLEPYFPSWSWTGWKGPVTYMTVMFWRLGDGRERQFNKISSLLLSCQRKMPGKNAFLELGPASPIDCWCPAPETCLIWLGVDNEVRQRQPPLPTSRCLAKHEHLDLFRCHAFTVRASSFRFPSHHTAQVKPWAFVGTAEPLDMSFLSICDQEGKKCGALFNSPVDYIRNSDMNSYSIIALSVYRRQTWMDGIFDAEYETGDSWHRSGRCKCILNVMLVKRVEGYDEISVRVAIGQMHVVAWSQAQPRVEITTLA